MSSIDKVNFHPIEWWKREKSKYPLLVQAVKYYLCIPATSAPSERIFSMGNQIVTKKRSTLLPEHVNMFIFLHDNFTYIQQNTPVYSQSEAERNRKSILPQEHSEDESDSEFSD